MISFFKLFIYYKNGKIFKEIKFIIIQEMSDKNV